MQTTCRIDSPRPYDTLGTATLVQIRGIAFSGDRGIGRVEVSMDNGTSWVRAEMAPPLSAHTWALWSLDWATPATPRAVTIYARAYDENGEIQTSVRSGPGPEGATGYPSVLVKLRDSR
jgi:hypothetical protein